MYNNYDIKDSEKIMNSANQNNGMTIYVTPKRKKFQNLEAKNQLFCD